MQDNTPNRACGLSFVVSGELVMQATMAIMLSSLAVVS